MHLALELPFPPSVNALYRSIPRGRVCQSILSAKGRAYYQAALKQIGQHEPLEGRLSVSIVLYPPDRRRRDIDNYTKAILDLLTKAGVWLDDSQIDRLNIARGEIANRATVTIEELE